MVALQFLILEDQQIPSTQDCEECRNVDHDVSETWEIIKRHWKLTQPKLIISVLYDVDDGFKYRELLDKTLYRLVRYGERVAAEKTSFIQGTHSRKDFLLTQM